MSNTFSVVYGASQIVYFGGFSTTMKIFLSDLFSLDTSLCDSYFVIRSFSDLIVRYWSSYQYYTLWNGAQPKKKSGYVSHGIRNRHLWRSRVS